MDVILLGPAMDSYCPYGVALGEGPIVGPQITAGRIVDGIWMCRIDGKFHTATELGVTYVAVVRYWTGTDVLFMADAYTGNELFSRRIQENSLAKDRHALWGEMLIAVRDIRRVERVVLAHPRWCEDLARLVVEMTQ